MFKIIDNRLHMNIIWYMIYGMLCEMTRYTFCWSLALAPDRRESRERRTFVRKRIHPSKQPRHPKTLQTESEINCNLQTIKNKTTTTTTTTKNNNKEKIKAIYTRSSFDSEIERRRRSNPVNPYTCIHEYNI